MHINAQVFVGGRRWSGQAGGQARGQVRWSGQAGCTVCGASDHRETLQLCCQSCGLTLVLCLSILSCVLSGVVTVWLVFVSCHVSCLAMRCQLCEPVGPHVCDAVRSGGLSGLRPKP